MNAHPEQIVISTTESVCPVCFARVTAAVIRHEDRVIMRKACPKHGQHEALLWRGLPAYDTWQRPKIPFRSPGVIEHSSPEGCPFDCGLCPQHRQQTCTALIEVTSRCNLRCTFCFADSGNHVSADPDLSQIRGKYEALLGRGYMCNVQLSGGEPTVRDDLPEIVAMGRSIGFGFIQLNTNGLRLASDLAYLERLKEAGLSSIFLQFDGTQAEPYEALRGRNCLGNKLKAIENCQQVGLGVVLVPTLVAGINLHQVGDIISFGLRQSPTVRGVHFQPATFAGRYPKVPPGLERITLPDLMREIESQTGGRLRAANFRPPGCENSHCSFHGSFVVMPDGEAKALHNMSWDQCSCATQKAEVGADRTRQHVAERWRAPETPELRTRHDEVSLGYWDVLLERARTHEFSISAMAFQDAWNLDLERLRDCCIHVVGEENRIVPFCAYNLTNLSGDTLYRGK